MAAAEGPENRISNSRDEHPCFCRPFKKPHIRYCNYEPDSWESSYDAGKESLEQETRTMVSGEFGTSQRVLVDAQSNQQNFANRRVCDWGTKSE